MSVLPLLFESESISAEFSCSIRVKVELYGLYGYIPTGSQVCNHHCPYLKSIVIIGLEDREWLRSCELDLFGSCDLIC